METIRPFQIALIAFFAVMALVSLFFLANFEGFSANRVRPYGDGVVIWGSFDQGVMNSVIQEIGKTNKDFNVVVYRQKDPRTFEQEVVNAIAEGQGPDVIVVPSEEFVTFRSKLLPISYETYPRRTFLDRFVDGAEIFARPDGIYAFPFALDPMVMYWNQDMFSTAGLATPPTTWEQVVNQIVPQLTRRSSTRAILQSAIAFGEYTNILHAKEMLLTLTLQSGSRMVEEGEGRYRVLLDNPIVQNSRAPLNASVQFFTDFSNSNSPLYSWNRAQEQDRLAFLGEDLALYFGYASEWQSLEGQNPNLNFDMAPVPQGASATYNRVYGTVYGFGILRTSGNAQGSYMALQQLMRDDVMAEITRGLSVAPASRAVIAAGTNDPYRQVAFNSALYARSWLDADPAASDAIFGQMIEDIVSNRLKIAAAVTDALQRLELAF